MRARDGALVRLLRVPGHQVVVATWQRRGGEVALRAVPAEASAPAPAEALELALERIRFALALDDDLRPFYAAFRRDPLLRPAIRRRPWIRVRRRPWAWEALAWAVTEQLIELERAKAIQRRIVRLWGASVPLDGRALRDVPDAATIAARAPAELAALDLSPGRSLALIEVAREVAAARIDPDSVSDDERLLAIRGIGPWTVQCLGLRGRGDPDSLPAGDLAYLKLVGRLAGLGRRAMVEEVEEFFAPYEPFRGLAGAFALAHYHKAITAGPPLRLAA
jgi:3-methyladenine DNA glycosylase/8-oxoguanine DNA glycosylase